jgi:putative transposase
MCSVFNVSSSGYYDWRGRPPSKRTIESQRLGVMVKDVFVKNRYVYGARRIQEELMAVGENVSRYRIGKLMLQQELKCKTKRKFKVTTDSNHDLRQRQTRAHIWLKGVARRSPLLFAHWKYQSWMTRAV